MGSFAVKNIIGTFGKDEVGSPLHDNCQFPNFDDRVVVVQEDVLVCRSCTLTSSGEK